MEEAMLEGLVEAVRKGYRADSSYKTEGWKLALDRTLAVAPQVVNLKQVKSKYDSHKKDCRAWKELCALSGWGWDEAKGVPVASEDVMDTYFEANPEAIKFRNAPPAFLNILQELFEGVLATGSNVRSIDEAIESCIDPGLLATGASQATDLIDAEDEEGGEDDLESESARSSIERSQSRLPSIECLNTPSTPESSSSTPSRTSSLATRKRAVERAARETESNAKRRRTRRVMDFLEETVEQITREMRATRQLIAQKSSQERASIEFIEEFSHLDPAEQLVVLRAFETESTARLFLVTAGVAGLRRSLIDDILAGKKKGD